jgi:carboxyl-terminal processing protease
MIHDPGPCPSKLCTARSRWLTKPNLGGRTARFAGWLVLLATVGAAACGGRSSPTEPTRPLSEQARAYLEELIGLMQAHSINRLKIDWSAFRTSVFAEAGGAQSIPATYGAIQVALNNLGDGHSLYYASTGTVIGAARRISCGGSGADAPALPGDIGYVRVPAFSGTPEAATALATDLQRTIMAADQADTIGWIVDVRGNGGGNMWPMIAGVGPLLGEGVAGYFIDPVGGETAWAYRDGAAWEGGVANERVAVPYRLRRDRPRVAVLIDNAVASSGEAVVIAFQGRPDTRSFGDRTCGLSTANAFYPMSDGATLNITEATMADRTRTLYGYSVQPAETVPTNQVVERAVAWLRIGM